MRESKRKGEWCCTGFQAAYLHAGKRGIGIAVARTDPDHPAFRFQFRAVDRGFEPSVTVAVSGVSVSIVVEMGARYCPWCGQNLTEWYGNRMHELYRPGFTIDDAPENEQKRLANPS